jgi:predicted nucleic acid-binding protein
MIVVGDTSCISGLFLIGQINLLGLLYGKIIVPISVWEEFLDLEKFGFNPKIIREVVDLQVLTPQNQALVEILKEQLDAGESEAIVLAKEINADLLLLDERLGTTVARKMGLKTTGILGILIEAKNQNHISAIKPFLVDLRIKAGFWLSEKLEQQLLTSVGEV